MPMRSPKATGHIRIAGHGSSDCGARFVTLAVRGEARRALMRVDIPLPADWVQTLNANGARLYTKQSQRELLQRIQLEAGEAPTFKVATESGWCEREFVLPDKVITCEESATPRWFKHLDLSITE